jgi:hypothetical protein
LASPVASDGCFRALPNHDKGTFRVGFRALRKDTTSVLGLPIMAIIALIALVQRDRQKQDLLGEFHERL